MKLFFFPEASLAFVSNFRAHLSKSLDNPAILESIIFGQYKMVVIRIVKQKNGETVYFDTSIPQVHFIKLISRSLYNSWHNLKNKGSLSIAESNGSVKASKIPPGHYTLETLAKQMEESLKKYIYEISADAYSPLGQLVTTNHGKKPLRIDRDLTNFLAISRELKKDKLIVQKQKNKTSSVLHSL